MAASKTTVAALMIVGKADLAQIMAVAKKPPAGTERSRKPTLLSMPREPQWRTEPPTGREDYNARDDRFRLTLLDRW
jgi:hypothetical protein